MTIWKHEENKSTHRLVKLYKEDHGEGEYMGDLDEKSIKNMIRDIKPDMKTDQAFGTLSYFGMLPLLIIKENH
ncbi:hypothetical protein MNB_SV-3-27 [hydrothermal vent metagenome]|uniref:Uncharacterized protein n=1 Tax=hydrothermal vent metagenome TaxID=652676 RepID=A0A1W1BM86_9ZZZZ